MPNPVVPPKSTDSPEELSFIGALKSLLTKHDPKDGPAPGVGGERRKRAIDDVVDEAITGAKGANPDY